MSLSNEDLQKYIGQSLNDVKKELENQGYKVHLVRTGSCATGYVPAKVLVYGEDQSQQKEVTVSFDGDDAQHKVTYIRNTRD